MPRKHAISVKMQNRGHGYGVFSYLEGYKFRVQSSYTFDAEGGKVTQIKIVGYEKGNITTDLKDRPAVKYDVEVMRDTVEARVGRCAGARGGRRGGGAGRGEAAVRRSRRDLGARARGLPLDLGSPARAASAEDPPPQQIDAAEVEHVETTVQTVADRLTLVEREYGAAEDPSELLELRHRFAEGETQYLLGEYANAAALLYDVVDAPIYKSEENRPDAIYYLADSALPRRRSWLELRAATSASWPICACRAICKARCCGLIDLSETVNDHTGIEELYQALVEQAGNEAKVKPEVVYVHAKWTARRSDIPDDQRIALALAAFNRIADSSEFGPQSRYFQGALYVQRGALDEADAMPTSRRVLALPQVQSAPTAAEVAATPQGLNGEAAVKAARAAKNSRLRDLATLAVGRVLYEQGKVAEATDRYQRIEHDSESYNDALYELSACYQKQGEFEKALRTTELLAAPRRGSDDRAGKRGCSRRPCISVSSDMRRRLNPMSSSAASCGRCRRASRRAGSRFPIRSWPTTTSCSSAGRRRSIPRSCLPEVALANM